MDWRDKLFLTAMALLAISSLANLAKLTLEFIGR